MFGYFGLPANVTDGQHVYMRAPATPDNRPLHEYTLMPALMRGPMPVERLRDAALAAPFSYMKNVPPLRVPGGAWHVQHPDMTRNLLWDLTTDPQQQSPMDTNSDLAARMTAHLSRLMRECDAPTEQYERLGLPVPQLATAEAASLL